VLLQRESIICFTCMELAVHTFGSVLRCASMQLMQPTLHVLLSINLKLD
jgi:hypothetical protein